MKRWVIDHENEDQRFALVIVYRYPSKTQPIIVNVYEYPTRRDAMTQQRRVKEEAKTAHGGRGELIACRVRPIHECHESVYGQ